MLPVQDGLTMGRLERTWWCWASNMEAMKVLAWARAVPQRGEDSWCFQDSSQWKPSLLMQPQGLGISVKLIAPTVVCLLLSSFLLLTNIYLVKKTVLCFGCLCLLVWVSIVS